MWGEKQEYWYLYTGIMLIAGISYVFYQRDIESKRLLTSIFIGLVTALILIAIQLILAAISSEIKYTSLIRELSRTCLLYTSPSPRDSAASDVYKRQIKNWCLL